MINYGASPMQLVHRLLHISSEPTTVLIFGGDIIKYVTLADKKAINVTTDTNFLCIKQKQLQTVCFLCRLNEDLHHISGRVGYPSNAAAADTLWIWNVSKRKNM